MSLKGYYEASLRPPAADDAQAATEWDWGEGLLDSKAYMADKENHTSARCRFTRKQDGKLVEMRVTLCLAPPPRVSYFCCHARCPDGHGGEEVARLFSREPSMLATEGNLALVTLRNGFSRSSFSTCAISDYYEYFVYQAGVRELTRLRQPSPDMLTGGADCFDADSIGVVPYRSDISTHAHTHKTVTGPSPKDDDNASDAYRIAALGHDYFHDSANGPHYLCIYDSKAGAWTRKPGAIPRPPPPSEYMCDMAITIGCGSSRAIVGWVDLWRGMLLADVLADRNPFHRFRYIPLPKRRHPVNCLPLAIDIARNFRDIVFVKDSGTIRLVDLQVHADTSSNPFSETPIGWTVVTWTMEMEGLHGDLETLGGLRFKQELELHSRDIKGYNLPKALFVSSPILSSGKDVILYLQTNISSETDRNSHVIAVDLKQKKLMGVKEFDMQRPTSYIRTSISSDLMPPVLKDNMKRATLVSLGSSRKKPAITNLAQGDGDVVGDRSNNFKKNSYVSSRSI
ncbi:hypothetical protein VPH35_050453 [Triticum aestivum]